MNLPRRRLWKKFTTPRPAQATCGLVARGRGTAGDGCGCEADGHGHRIGGPFGSVGIGSVAVAAVYGPPAIGDSCEHHHRNELPRLIAPGPNLPRRSSITLFTLARFSSVRLNRSL